MRPSKSRSLETFSGPHRATDTAQAIILLQKLLACIDTHWEAIVARCVVPWIPDHEDQPAAMPAEPADLKQMVAKLHSRCLSSNEFVAAIENQACCLTPLQAERLQVLLYALEDFEFADYLHLAIFHTRNRFVESPLGISPRSWDQQGPAAPIVWTTVHRFLPESYAAARNQLSRRQRRKSRATVSGIVDVEADLGKDVEQASSPEIEKWVQLMQKGGLPHRGMSDIAYLKARAHQKYKDAHARKSISLRNTQPRPQQDSPDELQLLPDMAMNSCRPREALLQGWNKIFPGEGPKFPSAERLCFTGLQNKARPRRSQRTTVRPPAVTETQTESGRLTQTEASCNPATVAGGNAAVDAGDTQETSGSARQVPHAPQDFSNKQFLAIQQRQQHLLQHRLAVYAPVCADSTWSSLSQAIRMPNSQQQPLSSIQPCSSSEETGTSMLNAPQGRSGQAGQGLMQQPPEHGDSSSHVPQSQARVSPDTYQSFTDREPVADSPITLFSLGSPYSSSSPWSASAAGTTGVISTATPHEWNKLMAVKSMVSSALVRKSSRASPLPHEGSGDFAKGLLKRSSSKHLGSDTATAKPGSNAPAGPKTGRRAVFSKETIKAGFLATHDNSRKVAKVLPQNCAAVQSSGALGSPATQPATAVLSSAPEVTFAEKLVIALPDLQPAVYQQSMQQQAVVEGATDLNDSKLSAADRTRSYVFKRSLSSVTPQRSSVPVASPLSRVVTYRPDQLRAAYQPPDLVNGLSQSRVQDSMWEESPVAATLRYSGMTIEQREKQAEFAAQLGQWYKEQLQRRVPSRSTNTRTVLVAE